MREYGPDDLMRRRIGSLDRLNGVSAVVSDGSPGGRLCGVTLVDAADRANSNFEEAA